MTGLVYLAAAVTPVDAAGGSVVGYVLGFGPLGIIALALAWLIFKGWRLVPPNADAANKETVRLEARADLLDERARVLAEKTRIEAERDEALKIAQTQIVPLLSTFTATTGALIPLLQEVVRNQEGRSSGRSGNRSGAR